MSEITNRIDNLLSDSHQRRVDLVRATGIPESTIRQWIKGSIPNAEAAYKVAQYLGVTVEWLVTGNNEENQTKETLHLSQEEEELLNIFRNLDKRNKDFLLLTAKNLKETQ